MLATLTGIAVRGVAAAVPEPTQGTAELATRFGEDEAARLARSTGIETRHLAPRGVCASDLSGAAAESLLATLGWPRESVDVLVLVSQTPDHFLPASACALHERLGLSERCAAFDVGLGCSGFVYGLWVASSLLAAGGARRALLLVGDTITRLVCPEDRATAPLFGDAGTATALEADAAAGASVFSLGTDGRGRPHLTVPAGAFRSPRSAESAQRRAREDGNVRSDEDLYMDGAEVFSFSLRVVPPLLAEVTVARGWSHEDVDAFVLHQANEFLIRHLAKKAGLPSERVVLGLKRFGNTSGASIPLALVTELGATLGERSQRVVLAGFGVGFSWGAAAFETGPLAIPALVRYAQS